MVRMRMEKFTLEEATGQKKEVCQPNSFFIVIEKCEVKQQVQSYKTRILEISEKGLLITKLINIVSEIFVFECTDYGELSSFKDLIFDKGTNYFSCPFSGCRQNSLKDHVKNFEEVMKLV